MNKEKLEEKLDYHKNKASFYEKKIERLENKKTVVIGFKRYDNTKQR